MLFGFDAGLGLYVFDFNFVNGVLGFGTGTSESVVSEPGSDDVLIDESSLPAPSTFMF